MTLRIARVTLLLSTLVVSRTTELLFLTIRPKAIAARSWNTVFRSGWKRSSAHRFIPGIRQGIIASSSLHEPTIRRYSTTKMTTYISAKREAPAALRNRDPIWNVLGRYIVRQQQEQQQQSNGSLTPTTILEISAGTGQHTQYFCQKLIEESQNSFCYYSSDPDTTILSSIQAYIDEIDMSKNENNTIESPIQLTLDANGIVEIDTPAVQSCIKGNDCLECLININMIHIAPWDATIGLMKVAGQKLKPKSGMLYLYGPYKVNGTYVESNQRFDESLRSQNPNWGIRNLEDVIQLAESQGLEFIESIEMPANNLSVIFRKK